MTTPKEEWMTIRRAQRMSRNQTSYHHLLDERDAPGAVCQSLRSDPCGQPGAGRWFFARCADAGAQSARKPCRMCRGSGEITATDFATGKSRKAFCPGCATDC